MVQAKKKYYDTELENLEKHQKQTIEKMETDHHVKLKDETRRIKTEQERAHHKFQDQMKHKKKEVILNQWRKKIIMSSLLKKAEFYLFIHIYESV